MAGGSGGARFEKVAGSVHRCASKQREDRRDVRNPIIGDIKVVIRQHREIRELPYFDLTLLADLAGEPGVRFGPQAQRLLAIECLRRGGISSTHLRSFR